MHCQWELTRLTRLVITLNCSLAVRLLPLKMSIIVQYSAQTLRGEKKDPLDKLIAD